MKLDVAAIQNSKKRNFLLLFLLPLLSGSIYGLVWNSSYLFLVQLVVLVPVFIALQSIRDLEEKFSKRLWKFVLAIFFYRSAVVYFVSPWIVSLTPVAFVLLVLTETVLFTLVTSILLYRKTPFVALVFLMILYEFIMQNVIFLVPFYQMGYAWGNRVEMIQYYSILGIEGGSALLYFVNYTFFQWFQKKKLPQYGKIILGLFVVISTGSLVSYYSSKPIAYDENEKISILHTEIDPKLEVYRQNPNEVIDSVANVAAPNSLVVLPEVFFNSLGWANSLSKTAAVKHIDSIKKANNQIFLTGAYLFSTTKNPTPQSRLLEKYNTYYNSNNTSILLDNRAKIKSKRLFIPFFEYVPDNAISQWINKHIADIGDDRKVTILDRDDRFSYHGKNFNTALCYESIYPLLMAHHSKNEEFMIIQANENWHDSKRLSSQYINSNRVNAIQNGLPIYRSSNYGYSAFIQPNGDMKTLYQTGESYTLMEAPLPRKHRASFYTKIANYSYILAGMALVITFLFNRKKETKPQKK